RPTVMLTALLLVLGGACSARTPTVIDGAFDDWDDAPVASDPAGDGGRMDLLTIAVASNAERVSFLFELADEINLQSTAGLRLEVTTAVGSEEPRLVWDFGAKRGRIQTGGRSIEVGQWDLGMLKAPTVSSRRFEFSFLRCTRDGTMIVEGESAAVTLVDAAGGDRLPDTGRLHVELPASRLPDPPPVRLERDDPRHVRVLTWNVLFEGLFKRPAPFLRVLRAIEPDVICFQEVWSHTARQAADQVSLALPGTQWHGAHTTDGLIVSRYPFLEAAAIDEAGNYWALIDLPDGHYDVDLSVVSAHPPCCDQEKRRQEQLDGMAAWLRMLKEPDGVSVPWGTPTVVAGDMNLVGGSIQLETLLAGRIVGEERHGPSHDPDWDGTALRDADPRITGRRENYTWRDRETAFAPGKLDYIVFTDSVLEMGNAFVLATEHMRPEDLDRYGLLADDTVEASDHLPVVADLTPTGERPRRAPGE
ncbi:MAG: hypothetical protein GF405_01490, partial [Candidatus Eisenbacteria bacterium]|nr:hypothetical protein [Candidatus Eisenbacteria bacterium]